MMSDARVTARAKAENQALTAAFIIVDDCMDWEYAMDERRAMLAEGIGRYLATMADAGWVMVRDVGEVAYSAPVPAGTSPLEEHARHLRDMIVPGWNACRLAMLADPPPER